MQSAAILDFAPEKNAGIFWGDRGIIFIKRSIEVKTIFKPSLKITNVPLFPYEEITSQT